MTGGSPVALCETAEFYGASWGQDDTIFFSTANEGILRVSGSGGTPEVVVAVEAGVITYPRPQLLPDGEWILFGVVPAHQIVAQSLVTGERQILIENGGDVRYLRTGHLVYELNGTLLAVPFDAEERTTTGGAVPVVEGVSQAGLGLALFDVAADGTLVYQTQTGVLQGNEPRTLVWVDREGTEVPVSAEPRLYGAMKLSPDGRQVAIVDEDPGNEDIWVYDLARNIPTRFTFDPAGDNYPLWTPNGERIVFASERGESGVWDVYSKTANGTGQAERLITTTTLKTPQSFAPDGQTLVFAELTPNLDLSILQMNGERQIEPLLHTEFRDSVAVVSPDGRWLAYVSDESGRDEVYVRPFPKVDEGRWQVSNGFGVGPVWGPNSREVFYQTSASPGTVTMMAVLNETQPTFSPGTPVVLFEGPYRLSEGGNFHAFDISPDDQRFLMVREVAAAEERDRQVQLVVVQNWFQELIERVPVP